jgi:hypothetical protein
MRINHVNTERDHSDRPRQEKGDAGPAPATEGGPISIERGSSSVDRDRPKDFDRRRISAARTSPGNSNTGKNEQDQTVNE